LNKYFQILLTASQGHKRISAINSAEADEMAHPIVLYLAASFPAPQA